MNKCEWELTDEDWNVHSTSCGKEHYFADGGIKDNEYEYCPYCGGEIIEKPIHDQKEREE